MATTAKEFLRLIAAEEAAEDVFYYKDLSLGLRKRLEAEIGNIKHIAETEGLHAVKLYLVVC